MANPTNPNVAQRSESYWWTTPIGVGGVNTSPVFMGDLPTADPHVVGQIWLSSGVFTVSAG